MKRALFINRKKRVVACSCYIKKIYCKGCELQERCMWTNKLVEVENGKQDKDIYTGS